MKAKEHKRREIIHRGSQVSEPIELTNHVIVQKRGKDYILRDETGKLTLWVHNQDYAGYVIRIGRRNYEYVTSL